MVDERAEKHNLTELPVRHQRIGRLHVDEYQPCIDCGETTPHHRISGTTLVCIPCTQKHKVRHAQFIDSFKDKTLKPRSLAIGVVAIVLLCGVVVVLGVLGLVWWFT